MESTKFSELCKAYAKAQNDFKGFQEKCYNFSLEIVNELKAYYKIPESQFSLFKIGEKNDFKLVQPAVINALTLRQDSMWQFGIGLNLCKAPESLSHELILIHILVRKDLEGNFYLKYANQEEEFKITGEKKRDFIPFFDYLHKTIIDIYEQQLTHFIGNDTKRKIGY